MQVKYLDIGICGVSCKLCPVHYARDDSRCGGCKDEHRLDPSCPFVACAITRKKVEFCWECPESDNCLEWQNAMSIGCNAVLEYQRIDDNVSFIRENGIDIFASIQKTRGKLLGEMLHDYDEGRYTQEYLYAASTLGVGELEAALTDAWINTAGMRIDRKSEYLHLALHRVPTRKRYSSDVGR